MDNMSGRKPIDQSEYHQVLNGTYDKGTLPGNEVAVDHTETYDDIIGRVQINRSGSSQDDLALVAFLELIA